MFTQCRNNSLSDVYMMLIKESVKDSRLKEWQKKWIKQASDKTKVNKFLGQLDKIISADQENVEMMDDITSLVISISKYMSEQANDELADLISTI